MSNEAAMFIRVGRQCRWWLWEWGRMVLAWRKQKHNTLNQKEFATESQRWLFKVKMWRYHVQEFAEEDGSAYRNAVVTASDDFHQPLRTQKGWNEPARHVYASLSALQSSLESKYSEQFCFLFPQKNTSIYFSMKCQEKCRRMIIPLKAHYWWRQTVQVQGSYPSGQACRNTTHHLISIFVH